jgi:Uma2 family endonuclease
MTVITIPSSAPGSGEAINYPSRDGQPISETFDHVYAILMTIELLRLYLEGQQATVLGNQFLYYSQGYPKLRTAPDVMVIFGVEPGGRDNYKIWEEGQVPKVTFEMTSPSTRHQDEGFKKDLYEQMGVEEYWQFDPKGEWIADGLQGYRLVEGVYQPIADGVSLALGLRLVPMDSLIAFYRLDSGDKLLLPTELKALSERERAARILAEEQAMSSTKRAELAEEQAASSTKRAELAEQQTQELAKQLSEYEARFGSLGE